MQEVSEFFCRVDIAIGIIVSVVVYVMRKFLRELIFQKSENKIKDCKLENCKSIYKKILVHIVVFAMIFTAYLLSAYVDVYIYVYEKFWYRDIIQVGCVLYGFFLVCKLHQMGYAEIWYLLLIANGINIIGTFIYTGVGIFVKCIKTARIGEYVRLSDREVLKYIVLIMICVGCSLVFIIGGCHYLHMIHKIWEIRIGTEGIKKIRLLLGISTSAIFVTIINCLLNAHKSLEILDDIMRIYYLFKPI